MTLTSTLPQLLVFGKHIKDPMPIRPGRLRVTPKWAKMLKPREAVMARCHLAQGKDLSKDTKELALMKVRDMVSIQNQHGNTP